MQIDPLLHHMRAAIYFTPFNNAIKLYCAMKRLYSQPLVAVQETKTAVICTTLSPMLHFTVNIMTQCGGQLDTLGIIQPLRLELDLYLSHHFYICPATSHLKHDR